MALGRPASELQRQISSNDFVEWQAYQRRKGPLGPDRWDIYVAMILAAISALAGNREARPVDFLPRWMPEPEAPSDEEFDRMLTDLGYTDG